MGASALHASRPKRATAHTRVCESMRLHTAAEACFSSRVCTSRVKYACVQTRVCFTCEVCVSIRLLKHASSQAPCSSVTASFVEAFQMRIARESPHRRVDGIFLKTVGAMLLILLLFRYSMGLAEVQLPRTDKCPLASVSNVQSPKEQGRPSGGTAPSAAAAPSLLSQAHSRARPPLAVRTLAASMTAMSTRSTIPRPSRAATPAPIL